MSPRRLKCSLSDQSFPRVSGDEPPLVPGIVWETKFSPRERG